MSYKGSSKKAPATTPMSILVKKLHESLTRMESFEVTTLSPGIEGMSYLFVIGMLLTNFLILKIQSVILHRSLHGLYVCVLYQKKVRMVLVQRQVIS